MYNPIIAHRYSTDISILRTQRASGIMMFPAKNVAADWMRLERARGEGGPYSMTQNSRARTDTAPRLTLRVCFTYKLAPYS